MFYKELKQLIVATCYECGQVVDGKVLSYLSFSQFLCPESKQRLLEARLEALSFSSVECFNELGQVQPLLQENDEQGSLDEVCEKILERYRNVDNEKKVPNRTLVDMKSQLVENFFKVIFFLFSS